VYYEGNQQNLNKDKGNIPYQINEDMVGISEDCIMKEIKDHR
jgi:hypothetical protein